MTRTASASTAAIRWLSHSGAGPLEVRARADCLDPRSLEVGKRVEKRVLPEIEGVIVGQGDTVDAEVGQCLRRPRRRPEVEDLPRSRLTARGDAALQVEQAEVGLVNDVDEFRGKQRLRGLGLEPPSDAAPQHGVAGEGELQSPAPSSASGSSAISP